mmetsp:Transcript_32419/g.76256  ORF Transcript_32419/g.76256 Transcript_32419/m.76256 type:complete len:553 (+) Transcript_32419:151-1809(+)
MKERRAHGKVGRISNSYVSSVTILVLMATTSTRQILFGCDALLARGRVGRSGGSKRCRRVSSLSGKSNDNEGRNGENKAPTLVLPSHPDFPITSVMAPMVAASDYPFRVFLREHCGVDLTFTQMLLAKKFMADPVWRKAHLDLYETMDSTRTDSLSTDPELLLPSQIACIGDWDEHIERHNILNQKPLKRQQSAPLMVQLAGDDVDTVVQTALMIYEHTDGKLDGIDLNCGCPQQIASKGNYGAFLMERDSELVNDILAGLRKNLPSEVSVSAKIRLPLDDDTLRERIPRLLDTGIDFLTVHGRTLKENKAKAKGAHIDRVRLAVEIAHKLDPSFPVIANGGMENYDDIQSILESTGASAAMSSEALLETPDLFMKESMDNIGTPEERFQRQGSFAKNYLDVCTRVGPPLPGVLGKSGSFNIVRGHLFKFLHRYINSDHQDLRDKLAANGETCMRTLGEARGLIQELESRYDNLSEDEWKDLSSSSPTSSWYRRHRQPDRRVHERSIRGVSYASSNGNSSMSVEDRKREIKERLAKMKARKVQQTVGVKQFV